MAANDIQTALEHKIPEGVYGKALFYEAGYNLPQAAHAFGMAQSAGDPYAQTLQNMGSQEAIQAANPSAYDAAIYTKNAIDIMLAIYGYATNVGIPIKSLVSNQLSKEGGEALLKYAISSAGDMIKEKSLNAFFDRVVQYYKGQAGGNWFEIKNLDYAVWRSCIANRNSICHHNRTLDKSLPRMADLQGHYGQQGKNQQ